MRDDAERIFFRSNRFIVRPTDGPFVIPETAPSRFEASLFLRSAVRSSALRHLRDLEIIFPPFETDYCPHNGLAHLDWSQTLDWARDKVSQSALSLRIHVANHHKAGYTVGYYHAQLTKKQGVEMLKTYLRILEPFAQWTELRRFHLHLSWPWSWTPFFFDRVKSEPDFGDVKDRWTTDAVRNATLGTHYDAMGLSQYESKQSQWLEEEGIQLADVGFVFGQVVSDGWVMDDDWKEILDDESLSLENLLLKH